MAIYLVKNKLLEEMGAFTNLERAIEFAEQLRDEFDQECMVEEIDFYAHSELVPDTEG